MRQTFFLLLILCTGLPILPQGDSFDRPLHKEVIDLGPSPYYPPGRMQTTLSCYFYRSFVVKQFDEGQKGAEWLAIARIKQQTKPRCSKDHAEGEKVIGGREWIGYFMGVKRYLVFFDAADGENGGMPFVVYDSRSGTKVFEDTSYEARIWNRKVEASPFNLLRVLFDPNGQAHLVYLRVAGTDCDLKREGASCWPRVRENFEIKSSKVPNCSDYQEIRDRWASAVAFPVEVTLFPQPRRKAIDGPVKCWPVD